MKICVVTPRFMISGVALAQHRFARALAARGHAVDLVIGRVDPGLAVPPSPGVNIIVLDRAKVRLLALPLWHYLRRARPDVVFTAEDHLNTLVTLVAIAARSKAKISGSSRVTPFDTYSNRRLSKRWLLKQLSRFSFGRADVLTCVSKDMVGQYRTVFGKAAPHVAVYNIIDDAAARARAADPVDEPWLNDKAGPVVIAAGTLAPWKGFAMLIDGFAQVQREARLIILGDGPLRGELEAQVERLGLAERVKLPGFVHQPINYFSRADVFALSSTVEGLPNVLVEAMIAGCTPVATDCPTGPREVLDGGRFGFLVPVGDAAAMAAAIEQALDQPIAPALLADAVRPFAEATVIDRHFALLGLAD